MSVVSSRYKPRDILEQWVIDDYYLGSQLVQKIVGALPEDAFSAMPTLSSSVVDAEAVAQAAERLGVIRALEDGVVASRKDGGAGIVLFAEDGRPPDQELVPADVTSLRGLAVFTKEELIPVQWSSSTRPAWYGERFNQPSHYQLNPLASNSSNVSGRWHRSRIVPLPHLRLNRYLASLQGYNHWGPGVIQGLFFELMERERGMERTGDVVRSMGYDHLEWPGLGEFLSGKNGVAKFKQWLRNMKSCRDFTGDGVAVVATPAGMKINPLSRNVTGLDKLLEAQRVFVLESTRYPEIRLFGRSRGGLGSDGAEGEWKQYHTEVGTLRRKVSPGLRQILIVLMAASLGPTGGVVDPNIKAQWAPLAEESGEARAKTRHLNAEARAIDVKTGVVSGAQARETDPSVEEAYPGIEDEQSNVDSADDVPSDIIQEADARRLFKVGSTAIRKAAESAGVRNWSAGGRNRYSLAEISAAMRGDSPENPPRTFSMIRGGDIHGVSGTGSVLDGVIWPDGKVSARWLTGDARSTVVFDDYAEFLQVHVTGHPGNETKIIFHDGGHSPLEVDDGS